MYKEATTYRQVSDKKERTDHNKQFIGEHGAEDTWTDMTVYNKKRISCS